MNTQVIPNSSAGAMRFRWLGLVSIVLSIHSPCFGQQESAKTRMNSSIESDGTGSIIVEARGKLPEPAVFFTAVCEADAKVNADSIEQTIALAIKVIQGNAKTLSLGLHGKGEVLDVQAKGLQSWSIRNEGEDRFLDLNLADGATELKPAVKMRAGDLKLPASIELMHLAPGDSVGFQSVVKIEYAEGLLGSVTEADGFAPLDAAIDSNRLQTSTGGKVKLSIKRSGAAPDAVELVDTTLAGKLHPSGKSIHFQLHSTANVTRPNSAIDILSGGAAVIDLPADDGYRLRLSANGNRPTYQLVFDEVGTFSVAIDFVATLATSNGNRRNMDFTVGASAIVPLRISGLESDLKFIRDRDSVVPMLREKQWSGYLPASGRAKLRWSTDRKAGEGKLFFTTTGNVEAKVGSGLLRQDHHIKYQVLQGELNSYRILMHGPGEILDVRGNGIVGWKVSGKGEHRQLDISLSQPVTASSQINIRSQTPLGAFPVRVEGLRLNTEGAIRHSGFLRLSNLGLVRIEPTGIAGLTQLAPEQFPGKPIKSRQVFVYRFPSAQHSFTVVADRIQPEVNVSQLVRYQLAETDRVIHADIELDIREAPVREWDLLIPSDYSVVSVTGSGVVDYIASSGVSDGQRNLKVVFGDDVSGRQLVLLHLEKSIAAAEGDWVLPRLKFPEAKTVRGDIGIIGAAGFRVAVMKTDFLVEKPLSYFPKPSPELQQAFRIRDPGWSATMRIELLDRSVQSDVFHLYSLSQGTVYGSALINYFVTGAPASQWKITVPETLGNLMVDGQDVRTWRREGDTLIVSLHQPVMGAYTLLVTFEEKPSENGGTFKAGQIAPNGVQGERGYIQVVSPMQVEINTLSISDDMLKLDPLELPAEFRLLSTAPPLGTWQYTERPFDLNLKVDWFEPGTTVTQVIEFSEANSRVSLDGELVTDVLYFVKSRGRRTLKIQLPGEPVRLWEVSVNGQPVTARQTDKETLIPLPGGTDPNVPIEVRLRLGKPAVDKSNPKLTLPIVHAPVLKTQWSIVGDDKHVLVPNGGTVKPPVPVLRPSGFGWVARRGVGTLFMIFLFTGIGILAGRKQGFFTAAGPLCLGIAILISILTALDAYSDTASPSPLHMSIPILSTGELVEVDVKNVALWRVNFSWVGVMALLIGLTSVVWSFVKSDSSLRMPVRSVGGLLVALGVLWQADGAPWFFVLLAFAIAVLLFLPTSRDSIRRVRNRVEDRKKKGNDADESDNTIPSGAFGAIKPLIAFLVVALSAYDCCVAAEPDGFDAADSITQTWNVTRQDARLDASGTVVLSGKPGDRFILLQSPAVLTRFESEGLRLSKNIVPNVGLSYVISIPVVQEASGSEDDADGDRSAESDFETYEATFDFHLEAIAPTRGIPVLTGKAVVQEIEVSYDIPGWDVISPTAVQIELVDDSTITKAMVLLAPGSASVYLKPRARDVTMEETRFFVEAANLYVPGPGVIDGRHRLNVRASQGQVSELAVMVPKGLTVSSVDGPIGSWQFDADNGRLKLEVDPSQSQAFDVVIGTQRGFDPLPAKVSLEPLKVENASGEVGLLAIAFGPDAQPDKVAAKKMSAVNLGDFDARLIESKDTVLHRVYRYGEDGGEVSVHVTPVDSEVRVTSKQVISLGDERVVLGVDFTADISRAGLFQLSFPLPDGLEVDSLSGPSLHHWAELTEDDHRQIILHLTGKTIGTQQFNIALSGTAPLNVGNWQIPRFQLNEATRQTGELVVRPTTGIRLRTTSRQNVSETDPRTMGGQGRGSLAFRLLQRDWNLVLGIEKLDAWVTGQALHEITLREGQTRTALIANFDVQNASIGSLKVELPIMDKAEIKTLRASGDTVSDFVPTDVDSNVWEVRFKRRVIGKIQFRIEYERRGDRQNDTEVLHPAKFPQSRQLSYYFAVRAGGRLELEHGSLSKGWQRVDWTSVPLALRESENRIAPAVALRAVDPAEQLLIHAKRHALADSLKLRVAKGSLTTILSPTGDQLTAVDVDIEVIQRSSLVVGLPDGGELFSIFVNGESVNSIRLGNDSNDWQFYILPGMDDRTAKVRFVYSVTGDRLTRLHLISPQLNVPLENIQWDVVAPKGFELTDSDGNLELVRRSYQNDYDRGSYLSKVSGKRKFQARQAAQLLDKANQLLQAGDQTKARWAFNSVANQYALDAASNEDARVQLENLQTQQAIVGLNTRRQRLYLDNNSNDVAMKDNQQLREAAADNPILQQDQMNFRPQQLGELLRGNTTEDNAILQQIAGRLVQHQRTTEPAPQAIIISLPEEGSVYSFTRSVQVAENAPLELDLGFASQRRVQFWRSLLVLAMLAGFAAILALRSKKLEVV